MKILLVEDSHDFRHKMKELLEDLDHQILEAGDGIEGYDLIKNHADIDLIISDLHMPNMDGFSVIEFVRQQYGPSELTIIVISALDSVHLERAIRLGANYALEKPFDAEKFTGLVKTLQNQHQA